MEFRGVKIIMQYWLIKTEPNTWSWQNQLNVKKTEWDGVRNYQARNNLNKMKKGDLCFFYHSVYEKKIIGVVKVVKESYPDTTDKSNKFTSVDISAYIQLKRPVSLEDIKAHNKLKHLALVKQSRLSVMPIDSKSWYIILKLSKTNIKN
tara:strand:- start:48 stop:494 length:447 start_codon:yes stop_codon:yes gene_type:complete